MTKKDFILIAKILRKNLAIDSELIVYLTDQFAEALKAENSAFDKDKFERAVWRL